MSNEQPIESSKSEFTQDTTPVPAPNGTRCNARGLPAGYLRSKLHTLAPARNLVFPRSRRRLRRHRERGKTKYGGTGSVATNVSIPRASRGH